MPDDAEILERTPASARSLLIAAAEEEEEVEDDE